MRGISVAVGGLRKDLQHVATDQLFPALAGHPLHLRICADVAQIAVEGVDPIADPLENPCEAIRLRSVSVGPGARGAFFDVLWRSHESFRVLGGTRASSLRIVKARHETGNGLARSTLRQFLS